MVPTIPKMSSAAMVTAGKSSSRPAHIRFFYRLILPTAVAAYSSNVNRYGHLTRQYTRPSHHVTSYYANKEPFLSSRGVYYFKDAGQDCPSQKAAFLPHRLIRTCLKSTSTSDHQLSTADIQHMKLAARLARIGYGNTYPNPAVGCVLVRHQNDDEIIGSGFHPRAGMPHAEVFALLEACGHVEDGVDAARSVMDGMSLSESDDSSTQKVLDLLTIYKSEDGANKLFKDSLIDLDITAYVTLEPCCHVGQTPPCALSLVAAGIKRVVVGFRDPNPKVDGGGLKVLKDSGVEVLVLGGASEDEKEENTAADECATLVNYFAKRISPRDVPIANLDEVINGKKRRALRQLAGRKKTDGTIHELEWPRSKSISDEDKKDGDFGERVELDVRFLEQVDNALWDHEIVLLRLNNVVHKKKGAKLLGSRIAEELNAHVAQVIGHTALLYRPAFVPLLDLDELASNDEDE
jgi:diaminohydroxyphosphoribosylaminopyrimidine deaminase/5-amino-6-(5-phosphoribosylamino)uracil reductase